MTSEQLWLRRVGFASTQCTLALSGFLFGLPHCAIAQRIPVADDTLGNERSLVSPDTPINGLPSNQIDGGAQRGANLFHSFREFNIDAGRGVYFTNPTGVVNILTRVTGGGRSDILGTLGVLGNANLFILNPNGILFGPNARLDIRGSFLASTASSVLFDNGFAFSTTNPQVPPLLTVNVPVGLQYGSTPGAIQTQGTVLRVRNGQTLTLAGGAVNVNGGQLLAPGGRVELAGVGNAGIVGLTQQGQDWRLNVPDGLGRANVAIGNNAFVDVNSAGGGSIAMTARNLTITGTGTRVQAGIAVNSRVVGTQAGDISIDTTEVTSINASRVGNIVLAGGTGNAGDINITTNLLSLTNGAIVLASTFGRGDGGNITITARDTVSIDGVGGNGVVSGTGSQVGRGAIGQGGDISITTGKLFLTNGGSVSASTFGWGNGGNITITASDTVSLIGRDGGLFGVSSLIAREGVGQGGNISITTGAFSASKGAVVLVNTIGQGSAGNISITARDAVSFDGSGRNGPSGAGSTLEPGAIGRGGDISITTGKLSITNGAQVSSGTLGRGDAGSVNITADSVAFDGVGSTGNSSGVFSDVASGAIGQGGNINITTSSLSLTNGGVIVNSISGQGNARNIAITARDTVTFDGVGSNGFSSGAYASVFGTGVGQGGTIAVNTELFSIINGGVLSASSIGEGSAGNLDVNVRQLNLDNRSSIVAETASGQGGNITLQVSDLLLLRRDSTISTTAGTAQAGGDGGNVTFNGKFIVAVPNENSDISANAFTGSGGRVNITVQGIFGIQFRPQLTPLSDITASSEFGVAGVVAINTPDVDPSRGLLELPVDLTDASRLIVQACPTGDVAKQPNEFIITGRGGLPPTPSEAINRDAIQVDLVTINPDDRPTASEYHPTSNYSFLPLPSTVASIVEAQALQVAADGTFWLVATTDQPPIERLLHHRIHCH